MEIEEAKRLTSYIRGVVEALNDLNKRASDAGLNVDYEVLRDYGMTGDVTYITVDISASL